MFLFINLLNVKDINDAINLIINKNIKANVYLLKNKISYKIVDIINCFNNNYDKKIKVKWLSNKLIKEKIYPYKQLKKWKPKSEY